MWYETSAPTARVDVDGGDWVVNLAMLEPGSILASPSSQVDVEDTQTWFGKLTMFSLAVLSAASCSP